jgi:hypothetical protein
MKDYILPCEENEKNYTSIEVDNIYNTITSSFENTQKKPKHQNQGMETKQYKRMG